MIDSTSISKWLWSGLALASLPLVVLHSIVLWNEPYAQLFWAVYLVVAFVFWKEFWSGEPISIWRFRIGWTTLVLSCVVGILANALGSSYLGQVAGIGTLGAFLLVAGGALHFVRAWVLIGLVGLLAIPSFIWEPLTKLINEWFVYGTSGILEYLAIPNVRTGWKFEFPKVAIDVDRLGWATESLYTTMLSMACYLTYRRRSVFDFVIRLLACPLIAFALFALKILLVYWASSDWSRNLTVGTSGFTFNAVYLIWYFVATWWMMIGLSWCFTEIPPPSSKDSPLLGAELFNRFVLWPFRPSYRKRIVRIMRKSTSGESLVENTPAASDNEPSSEKVDLTFDGEHDDIDLVEVSKSMRWLGWSGMGVWLVFSLVALLSYLSHPELRSSNSSLTSKQVVKLERNQELGVQPNEGQTIQYSQPELDAPVSLGMKTQLWTLSNGTEEIQISFHYPLEKAVSAFSTMEGQGWNRIEEKGFESGSDSSAVELSAREAILEDDEALKKIYVVYVLLDRQGEPIASQEASKSGWWERMQNGPIAAIVRSPTSNTSPYFLLRITQSNVTTLDGAQPEICRSLLKTLVPRFAERIQGAFGND